MGSVFQPCSVHAETQFHQNEAEKIKRQLAEPWIPPAKATSQAAPSKNKLMTKQPDYGRANQVLRELPDKAELTYLDGLPEPLLTQAVDSSPAERVALARALKSYLDNADAEAIEPLEHFTRTHSNSVWTPALLLNLGLIAYDTGYFSKSLDFWLDAWNRTKNKTDENSVTVANRAIAEYAKMCARIGRKEQLALVLKDTEKRVFQGTSRVLMDSACEGYGSMLNKAGIAYRCGPYALVNVAAVLKPQDATSCAAFLNQVTSPDTGFSLNQVQAMSNELGLEMQMAKRKAGSSIPIPAVVHWKVGHYGALTRELNGKYLLKDPTFGNETWMSIDAIDSEASGFFIIPKGDLPSQWEQVSINEASVIFGKGHSGKGGEQETSQCDKKNGGDGGCGNLAMATYSFHTLLASLSITDTPVGYEPAYGPDVRVRVNYNQREFGQPSSMAYTNFSPQWVCNWVSYLEDNPSSPGGNIILYLRGGGSETHSGFSAQTQAYTRDVQSAAVLIQLTANTYKKNLR